MRVPMKVSATRVVVTVVPTFAPRMMGMAPRMGSPESVEVVYNQNPAAFVPGARWPPSSPTPTALVTVAPIEALY